MSNAILVGLATKLATSNVAGGFANLFGNRVYLSDGVPDSQLPICVYTGTPARYERGMNGTETHSLSVVFTMYAYVSDADKLPTGQTRLLTLLDGQTFTASGYDRVKCILREPGVPELEDRVWSVSDVYELIGQRT